MDDLSRQELEEKSEFQGLIIMQNLVKEETYGAIRELHDADISTVMVTGDNILTAISVGRDCELVRPDQTIIRVDAELVVDAAGAGPGTGDYHRGQRLNVSYTLEENERSNIVHDVRSLSGSTCCTLHNPKFARLPFFFNRSPTSSSRCRRRTTCSRATARPSHSSETTTRCVDSPKFKAQN